VPQAARLGSRPTRLSVGCRMISPEERVSATIVWFVKTDQQPQRQRVMM
jgi:hypothetical protein